MCVIISKVDRTNDTAEEAQAGGIALPCIPSTLPPGWRQGDAQPDWTVEFASARFDGHHRAEGRLVAKLPCQQLVRDWLRLKWRGGKVVEQEDAKKTEKKEYGAEQKAGV